MSKFQNWLYTAIAEVSFYFLLYYIQTLLEVAGNLWVTSLILWALANLSIVFCPVFRKCHE